MIVFPESAAFGKKIPFPNPCIFRVTDEEGGPIETAVYPKVSGGVLYGDSAVFRYARFEQDLQMPSGVTTLESLLIHLAAELAGMAVRPGEPLKLFDDRHYAVESLSVVTGRDRNASRL